MIIIDGAEGEGGGQVVRNALALSLVTGEPFHITNIRGRREKPGLMRQHLTAVEAACEIGNVECEGVSIGSSEIVFRPGPVRPGDYHFAVGTAGSTGLVLQTVLMPLLLADAPSHLALEGGTHNMMAPPFEFIERVFLPIVNRMGPRVTAKLVRHGFYPRGGGRIEVTIEPAPLRRIDCIDRGPLRSVSATALFAGLPFDVADRELRTAAKFLSWPEEAFAVRQLPESDGPGNALLLEAAFEHGTEIVTGFGKLGVSAESIAKTAAHRMAGYMASTAFAGPYLADQLLLPFALAKGGSFTTVKPSQHARTAADVIAKFTGQTWTFVQEASGVHLVSMA
ncbi:RNA 3'-terminal phosphate cyclase (ATP) [Sphingobium sp. B1D7B]|uniref:RNA 3'-terminal phosphate cyclase n=1 Tax=unclassified Sphingobium TaxID=2611147 RepID=UPI00222436AE|nr:MULTISPECIES: RNA 3'-terminal phosphate cyclase [unclassified Sphingobium]MCW2392431.1 RNA 3'-terminal phosphate cyclase (ATP) [Sphingobium sp. B11D3A]MCW2404126.1 RNA 3'-terminal phosphate cyclase (ATP) [Sphingobium sp. B1D7B]